jgi:hypothetical protein
MMTTYKSPGHVVIKAGIELSSNRSRQTSNKENSNVLAEVSDSKKSKHFPEVSIRPYLTEVNDEKKVKGFQWPTDYSQVRESQLSFNNDNAHLVNNNSFEDYLQEENHSVEECKAQENKVLEDRDLNQVRDIRKEDEVLNKESEVQVENIDLKYKQSRKQITSLAISTVRSTIIHEQLKSIEQKPEDTSTQKAQSNNHDEIKEVYIEILPSNNLQQDNKDQDEIKENDVKNNEDTNLDVPNNYCDECKMVQVWL